MACNFVNIKNLSLREASTVLSVQIQALINRQQREIAQQADQEDALQRNLERDNLKLFPIQNDGNCLFNAFAHQLHVVMGLPLVNHKWLRELFCDTLDQNPTFWKPFLAASDEDFKKLIADIRKPTEWRNDAADIALNVLGVIFQVDVKSYSGERVSTYRWSDLSKSNPRREQTPLLSLVYSGAHYSSTVLRNTTTVHVGGARETSVRPGDTKVTDLSSTSAIEHADTRKGDSNPGIVHVVGDEVFSPGHSFDDWKSVKEAAVTYSKTRFFQHRLKNQTNAKGFKTARILCSRSWKENDPSTENLEEDAPLEAEDLDQGILLENKKKTRRRESLKCECKWRVNLKGVNDSDKWVVTSSHLKHTLPCDPSANQEMLVQRSRAKHVPPHVVHQLIAFVKINPNTTQLRTFIRSNWGDNVSWLADMSAQTLFNLRQRMWLWSTNPSKIPADVTFDKAAEQLNVSEFEQVFGEMLFSMAETENASLLVLTLQRLTKKTPGFWFQVWQDSNSTLTGVVWQTPRQKERLLAFGQTIFFDATCSTNKVGFAYWAPRGLNSECRSRTLFCALSLSEDHAIQQEMLSSVKEHNPGWTPLVMFGDRGISPDSITQALGESVNLFFCLWHITSQNMPQHWGKFAKFDQMSRQFKSIAECRTQAEYENMRQKFMSEFPDGRSWMNRMHEARHRWVLAWQMRSLTLGYRGTSVAESGNRASKSYLTFQQSTMQDTSGLTSVVKGSLLYEHDVAKEENRQTAEIEVKRSSLPFSGSAYQTSIFNAGYSKYLCTQWGEEFKKTSVVHITSNANNQRFELTASSMKSGKQYPYTVEKDLKTDMYLCTCCKVERYGYPCGHILAVLKHVCGPSPSLTGLCDTRYIHSRWRQEKFAMEQALPVELAPMERKIPVELAPMETEAGEDFDLGNHPGLADPDTQIEHHDGSTEDTKVSLSSKQKYAKFKKEADLLSRMASQVDHATFNVLFDHLTYMKQVAGGTGNPAILSEFHRVQGTGADLRMRGSRPKGQPSETAPREEAKERKSLEGVAQPIEIEPTSLDIDMARSIREPAPISQPGKKQRKRHRNAIETHQKEKKERHCMICLQAGHNQKKCPVVRQFGGMLTNELWDGCKWKALLPVSHRNQPARTTGLRSGVVAVVVKEVILPASADLEQQWLYVETYNPMEQQMKEAIVQASTLATWSKRGTSAKKRCYLKGEDRRLVQEDNTCQTASSSTETRESKGKEPKPSQEKNEESSGSDLEETGALIMSQDHNQPKAHGEMQNEDSSPEQESEEPSRQAKKPKDTTTVKRTRKPNSTLQDFLA